jgi:hypothetical protein
VQSNTIEDTEGSLLLVVDQYNRLMCVAQTLVPFEVKFQI